MNLECSSKGDKRFSALCAKVSVDGNVDTIERHYQFSKRFLDKDNNVIAPASIEDIKGKEPIYFVINDKKFGVEYLTAYYSLLWVKYLDANPELVAFANGFNEFTDMFRGKSINCQADVIKKYVKEGRDNIMESNKVKEFSKLIKELQEKNVIFGDLLKSNTNIVSHQVNCQGVMGAGIALSIKEKYPKVFQTYNKVTSSYKDKSNLLGRCLLLSENGQIINQTEETRETKVIANLFGQNKYGKGLQVDYVALEGALGELKSFAEKNKLSVGIPHGIGCGLAGGDWSHVKSIIDKIFKDYPINIYRMEV